MPSSLDFAQAAVLPLTAIAAWEALFDRLDLRRAVPGLAPAILIIGGFRVMNGMITVGTLVAFQALMVSFTAPVVGLVQMGRQLQEARGDILRLDDILAHETDREFEERLPAGCDATAVCFMPA